MKLCRCPVCHSDIHLDALLEDDAGREMLGIITNLRGDNARALVSYIALFRPEKAALSNGRALKLMREVLDMYQPSPLLSHALTETVSGVMKNRRETRNVVALTNHNYLKKVYEGGLSRCLLWCVMSKVKVRWKVRKNWKKTSAQRQYNILNVMRSLESLSL